MPAGHGTHRRRGGSPWVLIALAAIASTAVGLGSIAWMHRAGSEGVGAPTVTALAPSDSLDPSPSPRAREGAAHENVEEEPKGAIVIQGTGDVNIDPSYVPTFVSHGWDYAWSGLDGSFRRDDLTVINLECAVSDRGAAVEKEFNFRGDPAALGSMRRAGVEVANLGNNHAYDFGPAALLDTVRNVRRARIAPVGAGATQDDALDPARFELDGWKVAVLGFDQVVDPYPDAIATASKPGTAAGHDTQLMLRAIRSAARRSDIVVVTIHWGVELDTEPRPEQVVLGHRFVDAGADIVFGHHSHRLQPLDLYRGKPIFWSLGNFVWPDFSVAGSATGVGRVAIRPNGALRARLLPATIEATGHPVLR
ncbi:MAG: CapA family protein [Actinomycetota bacterium]